MVTPAENSAAFDDAGIPVGKSWDQITFPGIDDENTYGIEVSGNSLEPTYRDGTTLIVSPNASIRKVPARSTRRAGTSRA